jgi:hypothetical protein
MYFIVEYTHLVQQEGLELFNYLEKTFWTPFEIQQPGIVNKEIWIQPSQENPAIVKSVVTWYGVDFFEAVDKIEVERIGQEVQNAMTAAGFVFQLIDTKQWLSLTTIDQGVPDNDNDQDDNEDISGSESSGLDSDGYILPDNDVQMDDMMPMEVN